MSIAVQPQPIASPATTSVSQCTPRNTRLAPTATATATANAPAIDRHLRSEHLDKTNSTAPQPAAAAHACPLGNDGLVTSTSCKISGRVRLDDFFESDHQNELAYPDKNQERKHMQVSKTNVVNEPCNE